MASSFETSYYFSSVVYTIEEPQFLDEAKTVVADYLKSGVKSPDGLLIQTASLFDSRLSSLVAHIAQSGWNILDSQGYDMSNRSTHLLEFWAQEHQKYSGMDEHIHGDGAQLVGFYFLDCPDEEARIVFSDPNQAKKQINLPQKDVSQVTLSTVTVNFQPKAGMLMITNAWVPHLFTKNRSDKPFTFIHFTIGVEKTPSVPPPAEVI
jgi:hypothetical protein